MKQYIPDLRISLPIVILTILLTVISKSTASDEHASSEIAQLSNSDTDPHALITVRSPKEIDSRQGLPYFVGISETTAGSKGISMNLVVIPAGGSAKPHLHRGYESAIYLLRGRVETRYGEGLRHSMINQAGDFIYIPANVPHQPYNLSETEPAMAIVARTDPNEQESVESYNPEDN